MGKMFYEKTDGESVSHEIRILDHTGDSRMVWEKAKPETIAAAQQFFEKHLAKGFLAFKLPNKSGDKPALMRKFDPDADIVLSPSITPG